VRDRVVESTVPARRTPSGRGGGSFRRSGGLTRSPRASLAATRAFRGMGGTVSMGRNPSDEPLSLQEARQFGVRDVHSLTSPDRLPTDARHVLGLVPIATRSRRLASDAVDCAVHFRETFVRERAAATWGVRPESRQRQKLPSRRFPLRGTGRSRVQLRLRSSAWFVSSAWVQMSSVAGLRERFAMLVSPRWHEWVCVMACA